MPNWAEVTKEISAAVVTPGQAFDKVRRKYLKRLFKHTGRNVIAYYSGFLTKPEVRGLEISDDDKNGFMMAVHQLDPAKGLDLILHTPGGGIAAAHSLVDYLHKKFNHDVRAIVPQIAMSSGTIIACACKEVLMSKHSNLGPIDPQFQGVPATGVELEFKEAIKQIKADPGCLPLWQQIIGKYPPTFLQNCANAVVWSRTFVEDQLTNVMFHGDPDAPAKAVAIATALADYSGNKTHGRHIHADECIAMGMKVTMIETDQTLQDLVLTVHHCYMHQLSNTNAAKVIENHNGAAIIKQLQAVQT